MKKTFGRVLAVVLALCMLACLLPTLTFSVAAATEVTLTYTGTSARQADRYLIFLDGLPDNSDPNKYWNNNTIYVNGEKVTTGIHYTPVSVGSETDKQVYMLIYPAAFGKETMDEVTGEYIVQIKAGTAFGGEYVIANDLVWKLDGTTIKNYIPTTLLANDVMVQDGSTRFYIRMKDKYGLRYDTADIYWNNNTVLVDGNPVSAGINWWNGHCGEDVSLITMFPQYNSIQAGATTAASLGEHTLTVPYGTILGGKYMVVNELSYSINGASVQPMRKQMTATVSNHPNSERSGVNGFYFSLDKETPFAYDGANWTTRYAIVDGSITLDGTPLTSTRTICKYGPNDYYCSTIDNGLQTAVQVGSIITMDCTIADAETEVKLEKCQFIYNGTGWDIYEESTAITITDLGVRANQSNLSRFYIVYNTDVAFASKGSTPRVNLLIDGVSSSVDTWWNGDDENGYQFATIIPYDVAASGANHTVVVPAGTLIGGLATTADFTFYIYADGNISTEPPAPTTITITDLGARANQSNLSRFYIVYNTAVAFASKGSTPPVNLLIDGVSSSVDTWWNGDDENGYQFATIIPYTVAASGANHTVVVPAGTQIGGLATTADFTFYIYADGTISTEEPAPTTITITDLGARADQGYRFYVSFKTDVTFNSSGATPNVDVLIDGASASVQTWWHANAENDYSFVVLLPYDVAASGANHTVVVPAGTLIGDLPTTADFTFYIHADGMINTTPPAVIVPDENVKVEGATIKTDTDIKNQGMRYEVSIQDAAQLATAKEFGVLMLPKAMLGSAELTVGTAYALKIATKNGDAYWSDVLANGGFQAVLTNSTINGRQNLQIVSRTYTVMSDGTVVYGTTDVKSVSSVAVAIANAAATNGATPSAEVAALLDNQFLTDDEIALVLAFCRDNIDKL